MNIFFTVLYGMILSIWGFCLIVLPRIDVVPKPEYHLICEDMGKELQSYDVYTITCTDGVMLNIDNYDLSEYEYKVIRKN